VIADVYRAGWQFLLARVTRKRSRTVRRGAVGKVPPVGNSLPAYPTM
jgi:hypothetical protein